MELDSSTQFINGLTELVRSSPTWLSSLVLFFGAFIEYVFPPFPGDTVLVAGGFFISRQAIPVLPSALALLSGTLVGSAAGWWIGHFAKSNEKFRRFILRFLGEDSIEKIHQVYEKYGNWILVTNRFLPGVRGFFMIGAGFTGIPLKKVILFGLISSILWISLLIGIGIFVSESLEQLLQFFSAYTQIMLSLIVAFVAIWAVRKIYKRMK